ncbi:MAG: dihydrodipicolinate synthase family protein [Thermoproteota archaeon]
MKQITKTPSGIITAILSPLDHEGNLIKESVLQQLEFQKNAGVDGIFALGTFGEGPYLNFRLKKELIGMLAEHSKLPIIVHVGSSLLEDVLKLVRECNEYNNIFGVSSIAPFFYRPDERALITFYEMISKVSTKPVYIYNNPGRQGYNITPETFGRISQAVEGVAGIKDTSYNIEQIQSLIQRFSGSHDIYGAGDSLIFVQLMLAVKGHICGISNVFPEIAVKIRDHVYGGMYREALKFQYELNAIRKALQEFNLDIAPYKAAMKLRGIDVGVPVRPLRPLSEEECKIITDKLRPLIEKYLKT